MYCSSISYPVQSALLSSKNHLEQLPNSSQALWHTYSIEPSLHSDFSILVECDQSLEGFLLYLVKQNLYLELLRYLVDLSVEYSPSAQQIQLFNICIFFFLSISNHQNIYHIFSFIIPHPTSILIKSYGNWIVQFVVFLTCAISNKYASNLQECVHNTMSQKNSSVQILGFLQYKIHRVTKTYTNNIHSSFSINNLQQRVTMPTLEFVAHVNYTT